MRSYRLPLLAVLIFAATLLFFFYDVSSFINLNTHEDGPSPIHNPHWPFKAPSPPQLDLDTPPAHLDSKPSPPSAASGDTEVSRRLWTLRAETVKQAFLHAYHGYEKYAPFPADELLPLTNGSIRNFNAWGLTMVDSLDTMLLMGLDAEYQRAIANVATLNFTLPASLHAPFFETIIRYLGGFLSAYALSKDPILLSRADQLGAGLLYAFNTPKNIPMYAVNLQTQELRGSQTMYLSEIASCQMEYKYLAHLTGREEYFTKVEGIMQLLAKSQPAEHGMWPTMFDILSAKPLGVMYSVGAFSDSAYEYLLKQYLLSGKTEDRLATLYTKSMTGILENLLYVSPTRNLLYVTDTQYLNPSRKFEHLSCFFPGLLALGVETLPDSILSPKQKELHMWAAEGLAHTCWVMYADQPSGLGADIVLFESGVTRKPNSLQGADDDGREGRWMAHLEAWEREGRPGGKPPGVGNAGMPVASGEGVKLDYIIWQSSYLLRPETLEAMYVMYRTTKDPKWRERGWQLWEAIESKTRTDSGYASVQGVERADPVFSDSMPSYFLAETVKYAYLIAMDSDPWPADTYVLNTEAHPLPIFTWRDWEREKYGIGKGWPSGRV